MGSSISIKGPLLLSLCIPFHFVLKPHVATLLRFGIFCQNSHFSCIWSIFALVFQALCVFVAYFKGRWGLFEKLANSYVFKPFLKFLTSCVLTPKTFIPNSGDAVSVNTLELA